MKVLLVQVENPVDGLAVSFHHGLYRVKVAHHAAKITQFFGRVLLCGWSLLTGISNFAVPDA